MKPIILVFLLQIGSLAPMALVCPWSDEDRSVTVEASPDLEQWVALARVEPEEGFRVETPAASPVFYRITCSTNPPDTSSPSCRQSSRPSRATCALWLAAKPRRHWSRSSGSRFNRTSRRP